MNEVSKLGQSEEEPIEGVIVGPWAGPGPTGDVWKYVREAHLYGSYHYAVDEDGIHDTGNTYKTDWMQVFINGKWIDVGTTSEGVTYERGPSFTEGWWDEVKDWKPEPIEVEFSSGDISDEVFRLMTGYDRNVLIAATKLDTQATVPPVDPEKVKWPHAR